MNEIQMVANAGNCVMQFIFDAVRAGPPLAGRGISSAEWLTSLYMARGPLMIFNQGYWIWISSKLKNRAQRETIPKTYIVDSA